MSQEVRAKLKSKWELVLGEMRHCEVEWHKMRLKE